MQGARLIQQLWHFAKAASCCPAAKACARESSLSLLERWGGIT